MSKCKLGRKLRVAEADGRLGNSLTGLQKQMVGLLYDETSLQTVLDLTRDWTKEERQMLRNKVTKMGLKTPFRDGLLKHVAEDILQLAKDGLQRRGFKETSFLNEVSEVVRTAETLLFP
ncbi:hypothetical protein KI387_020433 [Taxus chinensis]|uniref:Uncharacterized protein n=1 Tax=Taxus chinensis TaxID=29808 RepID=A0AA38LB12_TAXCH|nr:hypothetical protein KI387_020433 [Taxus chinensis]